MPRRKASNSIGGVLAQAENLRKSVQNLPDELREKTKELALAIVTSVPKKRGRHRKVGRPSKTEGKPQS